jgi:hypothetical protein
MNEFFNWLSNNPVATLTLIVSFGTLVTSSILIFIVAFFQGREISFWPPKIGPKLNSTGKPKGQSGQNILKTGIFTADPEHYAQLNLVGWLNSLRTLDISAYNLTNLLKDLRQPIADAVARGAYVRILIIDHTSLAHQLMLKHSRRPHLLMPDAIKGMENIQDIQSLLKNKPRINGKFEVKLTSWISSCSMILIDSHEENGVARIGIRPPAFRYTKDRVGLFLTRKEHPTPFEHFVKSFDALWDEVSYDWDGTIPPIGNSSSQPSTSSKKF